MAKSKKTFKYRFVDCEKELPSNVEVTCSQSGEKIMMYHKMVNSLVKRRYDNNWKLFETTYIKKGNRAKKIASTDEEFEDINRRPEGYKQYLIMSYLHERDVSSLPDSARYAKMDFYDKCFFGRWGITLKEYLRTNEQS